MITRIAQAIVSLIALLTFVVIGARVINSFETWECTCIHDVCEECGYAEEISWELYHDEAMAEYANEFTALFNSYTFKVSKNGRSMINGKFVKKG